MTDRTKTARAFLAAAWSFAVIAAFLVALPLLAVALLLLAPAALSRIAHEPLPAVLVTVWPVAGAAGLFALLISRHRGRFSLRQIRTRQVLIAAGIVAAHVAIVFIFRESGLDDAFAAVCIAAFAVLILEGAARIRILQARAAAIVAPTDRIPEVLLGIAVGCAFAAIVGHLWI